MNKILKKFVFFPPVQILRFTSLVLVILFFILVPLSNWYANQKIAYNQGRLVELANGPVAAFIYESLDSFYTIWDDPVKAATSNNGSLWAYTILGVSLSDPLGLISELLNSVKFPVKYLLGALIPFLVTIILGRVFCSWLCPMHVIFSVTKKVRCAADRLGIPLFNIRIDQKTRIWVFFIGLVLSYLFGAWVWHFVLPYITFTHEIFSIVIFSCFTVGVYFLLVLLLFDFALAPGEFCRSICPTGFLLAWIGRVRLVRLKVDVKKCPPYCIKCKISCPLGLYPKVDSELNSCHLCMLCVNNCPSQSIKPGLSSLRVFRENPENRNAL